MTLRKIIAKISISNVIKIIFFIKRIKYFDNFIEKNENKKRKIIYSEIKSNYHSNLDMWIEKAKLEKVKKKKYFNFETNRILSLNFF